MTEMPDHEGSEAPNGDAWGDRSEPQPAPLPSPRRRSLFTTRLSWRGMLLVILGVAALRLWVLESVIVDGRSMADTLQPDEWVLVLKLLKPERFAVATFMDPEEQVTVIKRVVGMPGDTIAIEPLGSGRRLEGSRVYLNDVPLEEPYATSALPDELAPTTVPDGSYFVLGDNRDDSVDSRTYGPVQARSFRGRAVLVVYPFSHLRLIPHVAEPAPQAQAGR